MQNESFFVKKQICKIFLIYDFIVLTALPMKSFWFGNHFDIPGKEPLKTHSRISFQTVVMLNKHNILLIQSMQKKCSAWVRY